MTGDITDRLHDEVMRLAEIGTPSLPVAVESLLLRELDGMPLDERLRSLELLANRLSGDLQKETGGSTVDTAQMSRLFSILLGKELPPESLSNGDMTEKFVDAMNTVFDTMNRIVRVMQDTLVGRSEELETIRQVIGSQLGRNEGAMSVREYLDQIQQAFLLSHSSFQQAARNVTGEMLAELDPDRISSSAGSGLKFGSRKAELYDIFQKKHSLLADWLQSGQFTERLLREFESICRKSYHG